MSVDPFIANMMSRIFNCYKEHGWRIVIMYSRQSDGYKYPEFCVLGPKELEWIEKEFKIIKDIKTFEEVPAEEYTIMISRFAEELRG